MSDSYTMAPPGSSLVDAANWIRDALTGSLALSIAILAVAWLGFAMLQGRLLWRDGLRIVLGCFILFGSSAIATSLTSLGQGSRSAVTTVPRSPPPPAINVPQRPPVFDPYAGASVPNQ